MGVTSKNESSPGELGVVLGSAEGVEAGEAVVDGEFWRVLTMVGAEAYGTGWESKKI
jgi:hypothetical protein